ncbi:Pentatricopeptide repeat-containing protein, partial [Drosera capensis]
MISCMEQMGCEADLMTYNMVLEGFYKLGESNRVEKVWKDMELKKLLNFETYLIMVCSLVERCNILEACKKQEEGLTSGLVIASSKIDEAVFMLCKGGFVVEALDIAKKLFSFDEARNPFRSSDSSQGGHDGEEGHMKKSTRYDLSMLQFVRKPPAHVDKGTENSLSTVGLVWFPFGAAELSRTLTARGQL